MVVPAFTLEQKARAFDELWESCGSARGRIVAMSPVYQHSRIEIHYVPTYEFAIGFAGHHTETFKDVLRHLATKKETPEN